MDAQEMKALFQKARSYENVPVLKGEMSPRERYFAIMDFEKYDRIIDMEFGYWDSTLRRWHNEGLPKEVNTLEKADVYFGFDRWERGIPAISGLHPSFPEEIIEQNPNYTIKYDANKVKCQVFTDGTDTIPHYLDFPIKDRETYLPFKERYMPNLAERIPSNIATIAEQVKDRNYVLQVFAGSTAGWVRDLMGFEGFSYGICLQPELLDEILSDLAELFHAIAVELTKHVQIDQVAWWEDIAFKTGPIAPPDWFAAKCGPVYKRAMDVYAAHGTRFSYVDCDGDNRLLVPTWLDNGVNIIFPLEVNAGVHPEALRKRYPGVRMMGGFDKVVLLKGKEAIRKEFARLKPLVDEGGFIPHVDHRVQADVSYGDYLYYLEVKRDFFGIPNKVLS
jgi:uroporphyrinogen decarboxylase